MIALFFVPHLVGNAAASFVFYYISFGLGHLRHQILP